MAIQTLYDTGDDHKIPAEADGGCYQAGMFSDCVVAGLGNEFAITTSPTSLEVTFAVGCECKIGGAFFRIIDSPVDVELAAGRGASNPIYLCARINKGRPNGSRGVFEPCTIDSISYGDINGSATTRDLPLYKITTSSSGVLTCEKLFMPIRSILLIKESEFDESSLTDDSIVRFIIEEA